jgi:hypothetical protein
MRNFLNLMPSASEYFSSRRDEKADRAIVFALNCGQSIAQMLLCLTVVSAGVLHPSAVKAIAPIAATPQTIAQTGANAPAPLTKLLTEIDAAANRRDVKAVMAFYSPSFTHSDGLNSQSMEKALTQLWDRYPSLNYRTEINLGKPKVAR